MEVFSQLSILLYDRGSSLCQVDTKQASALSNTMWGMVSLLSLLLDVLPSDKSSSVEYLPVHCKDWLIASPQIIYVLLGPYLGFSCIA